MSTNKPEYGCVPLVGRRDSWSLRRVCRARLAASPMSGMPPAPLSNRSCWTHSGGANYQTWLIIDRRAYGAARLFHFTPGRPYGNMEQARGRVRWARATHRPQWSAIRSQSEHVFHRELYHPRRRRGRRVGRSVRSGGAECGAEVRPGSASEGATVAEAESNTIR